MITTNDLNYLLMISILEEDNFELCSASCYIIVRVMVFNVTFNNMLVISWQSVLLVEETGEYI